MKKASDKLFRLIKSMTQSEKRYFKRFTQQHTIGDKNKYVELFELIHDLEEYNEQALLLLIKDKMLVKNFAENKRYLYQQILRVLRNFESTKIIHFQLLEYLMEVQILYKKGIYDDCKKLIQKAKKKAMEYEYFSIIFELNSFKLWIALAESDYKVIEEHVKEHYLEEQKIVGKIDSILFHKKRQLEIYLDYESEGRSRKKGGYKFDEEKYPVEGFNASRMYFNGEFLKGMIWADYNSVYKNAKAQYLLYINAPHQINSHPAGFIVATDNYLSSCEFAKYAVEGLNAIDEILVIARGLFKMRYISEKEFLACQCIFEFNRILFLKMLANEEDIRECYEFCKFELLPKLNHEFYLRDYLLFLTGIAIIEVLLGKADDALSTFHQYNNLRIIRHRPDLESLMRMLAIIANFEEGNHKRLESLVNATYQFMRGKGYLNEFEKLFLSFFKNKILKLNSFESDKTLDAFKQLKKEIQEVLKEHSSEKEIQEVFDRFDFVLWIESKIQNKPMIKLLQNKSMDS